MKKFYFDSIYITNTHKQYYIGFMSIYIYVNKSMGENSEFRVHIISSHYNLAGGGWEPGMGIMVRGEL